MKFQNYFYLVAMLFLTFSCHRENDLADDLSKNIKVELNQKSNVLKFGSKADLKEFINNYDKNSNRILDFYKEGFIPYRTTDNVDEATFIELTQKKKTIQSKSRLFSKSNHLNKGVGDDDEYDDENELINNDKFASILNAEREVQVEDKVYFYTEDGLFFADEEDEEYLRNYLANNSTKATIGEAKVDDKISSYSPDKSMILNDVSIEEPSNLYPPMDPGDGGPGGPSGPSNPPLTIPSDTSFYQNCVPNRPWVDNIFGKYYVCEYYFFNDKKLRSSFGAEDYYLWFDVYAQAKFKKKTWLGWYSCRDADKVYVKVKNAIITMKDRSIKLKLNASDLQKIMSDVEKLLENTFNKRVTFLSNVYTTNNGDNTTVENYSLSQNELISGANSNNIVTPVNKSLISNVSVNFKDLFGKTPKKVLVFTILGKPQAITDQQILNIAYQAYKQYIVNPNTNTPAASTGVVIMQKAVSGESPDDAKIVSYAFGNDLVEVTKLAVAERPFNIPKRFKLEKALLTLDLNNWKNSKIDIDVSWKVPDKYDVEIEGGAYYYKWGGSKFRVVRN